jgi:RNA polymerase sigma factor for flagellar operon FliA
LVSHIVAQQCLEFPAHVDREELVRAGALGLVEAARRFDPSRGMPFARFAGFRIRGAVVDALRTNDWAPRSVRRSARALEVSRAKLTAEAGRSPSVEELARDLGTTVARVADLEADVRRGSVLSLDRALTDEDGSVSDGPSDEGGIDVNDLLEDRELRAYLRDAVSLLPERHRLVIVGYFFEGKTSAELARLLGVSESRVSQLRSEAFTMLRDGIESQYTVPTENDGAPRGRVARRQADYADAVAGRRPWRDRLDRSARTLVSV